VSASDDEQLEQALAGYTEQLVNLREMQGRLGEISCSVTSARQVVSVTVGFQGRVSDVKFPTGAYKRMAPAELAAVVLSTINEAHVRAQVASAEVIAPTMPAGVNALDVVEGKADLQAMLPAEPGVGFLQG
jgi:DNA-binding protein YbaB